MTPLLQYVVTGLTTGATYALVGLGIALIVQVTGVVNFAQGEFVMLGGLTFALLEEKKVPAVPAALVAVAGTVLVGVLLERLVLPRHRAGRTDQTIMLTIGASVLIEGAAFVLVGTEPHFARPFTAGALHPFGVTLYAQYLWIIAVTGLVMVGLWLWLTRTRTGWAMRATAMDPDAARLSGITPARMSLAVFALAAALGGIGGVVLAPLQSPDASIGISVGLKGFTAAVIGGLDWPVGAVIGGLVLGVVESVAAGFLPSGWGDAVTYTLLLVVLLVRPTGLVRAVAAVRV